MCVRLWWTALWPPSASRAPQLLLITDAVCLWFCPRHSESLLVRLISACLHWRDLINTITDGGSQHQTNTINISPKTTDQIQHSLQLQSKHHLTYQIKLTPEPLTADLITADLITDQLWAAQLTHLSCCQTSLLQTNRPISWKTTCDHILKPYLVKQVKINNNIYIIYHNFQAPD